MPKVYIVGGSWGYGRLFVEQGWETTVDLPEADIVCFTGGEDVSPYLYGEKCHLRTYSSRARDSYEKEIFNQCMTREIPMVGICRGGQFLNCLSGGKMYQHVSNHTIDHDLIDVETGAKLFVSSTHHQMMRPGPGGQVLAIAKEGGYKETMENGEVERTFEGDDTEIVFYPLTKSLCFQPHPEFDSPEYKEMKAYFFQLINDHLKVN